MTAYFILLLVPCVLSGMKIHHSRANHYLLFCGIFYSLFMGLKHFISPDWWGYIRLHRYVNTHSLGEALSHTDPGYALLNMIFPDPAYGIYFVTTIAAAVFMSGLLRLASQTETPWLAVVSVTPFLVIAIGMSAIRQSIAIGLVFHLLASWNSGVIKKTLISLVAMSFHASAVIALFFVFYDVKNISKGLKYSILIVVGSITAYVFLQSGRFAVYEYRYLARQHVSAGALQHMLLNAIPAALYLFTIRRWEDRYGKDQRLLVLSIVSILGVLAVFVSSTMADRLSLYLSPIQILVYGSLPTVLNRSEVAVGLVGVFFVTMLVWFKYANNSAAFLPYDNVLFHIF